MCRPKRRLDSDDVCAGIEIRRDVAKRELDHPLGGGVQHLAYLYRCLIDLHRPLALAGQDDDRPDADGGRRLVAHVLSSMQSQVSAVCPPQCGQGDSHAFCSGSEPSSIMILAVAASAMVTRSYSPLDPRVPENALASSDRAKTAGPFST